MPRLFQKSPTNFGFKPVGESKKGAGSLLTLGDNFGKHLELDPGVAFCGLGEEG